MLSKFMNPAQLARLTLGFVFVYQGLVPKLIFQDAVEIYMDEKHLDLLPFLNFLTPVHVAQIAGVLELVLGLLIICLPKQRWPVQWAFIALALLLLDVIILMPELLTGAFNPVISNIAGMTLAYIALSPKSHTVRLI